MKNIVDVCINKISLWIRVGGDDRTAERVIIASNALEKIATFLKLEALLTIYSAIHKAADFGAYVHIDTTIQ